MSEERNKHGNKVTAMLARVVVLLIIPYIFLVEVIWVIFSFLTFFTDPHVSSSLEATGNLKKHIVFWCVVLVASFFAIIIYIGRQS